MTETTRRVVRATMLALCAAFCALGLAAMPAAVPVAPVVHHHSIQHRRPVWDGNGVWTSAIQPTCPASDAGHWGVGRMGATHFFTVRCDVITGHGAWDVVQTSQIGGQ